MDGGEVPDIRTGGRFRRRPGVLAVALVLLVVLAGRIFRWPSGQVASPSPSVERMTPDVVGPAS